VTESHHVLRCSRGSWTNDPTAYTHQWYRNGAAWARASAPSYRLGRLDEGTKLTCAVTARNVAGQGSARSSGVRIPIPHVPGCPAATGTMTGTAIGRIKLGMTGTRARDLYRHHSDRRRKHEDSFCLTPAGVRVGYSSRNRVVWASTSNPYYSLDGVYVGERFDFQGLIRIGLNYSYASPDTPRS
jgi:hypothetical protein